MALRDYQSEIIFKTERAWIAGAVVVLMRLATGGGKTVCFGDIIRRHLGFSCLIVHRSELVVQISLMLARLGIRHDIIASAATRQAIARMHVELLGACFYQPGARCAVASVDTLVRAKGLETWAAQVTLWICDEGHHALRDNKWGRAIQSFTHPQCRGLLPTATPVRADGLGLGSHADGFADVMVEGPPERWLIDQGFLSDYDVYCPTSDMEMIGDIPASGDYSPAQLRDAAHRSHITGDMAASYQQFGRGGLGISFCTDVDTAVQTCEAHRSYGLRAEVVTGDTDMRVRREVFRRAETGQIDQICVVDIVSEGTDLPACVVGSFGRPSESLGLVRQQIGRLLRPMYAPGIPLDTQAGRLEAIARSVKPRAILIDHVRHFVKPHIGPPDRPRVWSLDRRDKKAKSAPATVTVKVCTECFKPYDAYLRACKHCGHEPQPASRAAPAAVEGELALLDPAVLARLRGDVVDVEQDATSYRAEQMAKGARPEWIGGHWKHRQNDQAAQLMLRAAMARWAGPLHARGLSDGEIQRSWWLLTGVDVMSAQALGAAEAWTLTERIDGMVNS